MTFERLYPEVLALVTELWEHPELGYGEHRAAELIDRFLADHVAGRVDGLTIESFSTTGRAITLPPVTPAGPARRRIAVVAELDAVISPAHPDADPATGAVHACGHHTQVGIALAALAHLVATGTWREADVDLTFVFVPAEEFVDLAGRAALREQGEITWFGGKPEAMMLGVFDAVDAAVCLHAIGGLQEEPTIEVDCDLAGFLYKTVEFEGTASHAGLDPFSGTNAYAMATLFTTALGLSRQQLREDVLVRMNPVIPETEMTTNVIPHRVRVGTDVRSIDLDYLGEVAERVDRAAHGCAAALGGTAHITTEMGYLPFVQDRALNGAFREAFEQDETITRLIEDRGAIAAAGDAGDLSFLMPTVQLSYGGFDGVIHGRDFRMVDPEHVLIAVPRLLTRALQRMGRHLPDPLPRRSYEDYVRAIARIAPLPAGVSLPSSPTQDK